MTETAPEIKTPAAKTAATAYVVLEFDKVTGGWSETTTVNAQSSEQAIRKHATGAMNRPLDDTHEITLVAIPARSWWPVKVSAKVTTAIVLEDAK